MGISSVPNAFWSIWRKIHFYVCEFLSYLWFCQQQFVAVLKLFSLKSRIINKLLPIYLEIFFIWHRVQKNLAVFPLSVITSDPWDLAKDLDLSCDGQNIGKELYIVLLVWFGFSFFFFFFFLLKTFEITENKGVIMLLRLLQWSNFAWILYYNMGEML